MYLQIHEGTTQIQQSIISKELIGMDKQGVSPQYSVYPKSTLAEMTIYRHALRIHDDWAG